ncbi:hypothetical protein [Citrobacter youngae]|uniref:hypothetical protein n=1 Tax=Citrobacter youngae TaxID=133448 RepID=UPI003EE27E7D
MEKTVVSTVSVYRYDDGMHHLVVDFPQYSTRHNTLCGISCCSGNQRRGRPRSAEADCPDCEYALKQIRLWLHYGGRNEI